ncbi:MAG: virulence RhuM family protein [Clostridiales Family XIII bacterium]|jgi:hypothetical protein|nr:virulence RhuM family protein [Clostridiales Family XIII bacterium]
MGNTNEIVLYQPDEAVRLEVMLGDDTVWLTLEQMTHLFGKGKSTINEHILNAYKEGELSEGNTKRKIGISDFSTKPTNLYNLDVIISVGYRVKSQRGTQFRIWATSVLRDYLLKGYAVNHRVERIERRLDGVEEKVDFFVRTALPPVEGIFYEGQIFDAYEFASKLVKSAKKRIVLIDNYVDETVLALLAKRRKAASALICTSKISKTLQTDVDKHNAQYPPIAVCRILGVHDRFLIVDENVYHIGASIKDLGKKLFAFSKLSVPAKNILNGIATAEES